MLFNEKGTTLFQSIMQHEKQNKVTFLNTQANEKFHYFDQTNLLYRVSPTSTALKNLLTTDWNILKDNEIETRYQEANTFKSEVIKQIIKIKEPRPIWETIKTIIETAKLMKNNFAGALLSIGSEIVNPLHPLTALALIEQFQDSYIHVKLAIYSYNNERDLLDDEYHSHKADLEKIEKNITNLIRTFNTDSVTEETKKIIISTEIEENKVKCVSREKYADGSNMFIIPIGLLTDGVVMPYYGTALLHRNYTKLNGLNLSPMRSANIGTEGLSVLTNEPVKFRSTCTGSTPPLTYNGMRTLSHANLSSPLNREILGYGSLVYADKMIEKSIELYEIYLKGIENESSKHNSSSEDSEAEGETEIFPANEYETADDYINDSN